MPCTSVTNAVPFCRSNSDPTNAAVIHRTPEDFYACPSTLREILFAPRQCLTSYEDGMRTLPRSAKVASPSSAAADTSQPAAPSVVCEAAVTTAAGAEVEKRNASESERRVEAVKELGSDAAVGSVTEEQSVACASADPEADAAVTHGAEVAEEAKSREEMAEVPSGELPMPTLRATCSLIPYDPQCMSEWLIDFRNSTGHVPPGVQTFIEEHRRKNSSTTPSIRAASLVPESSKGSAKEFSLHPPSIPPPTVSVPPKRHQSTTPVEPPSRDGGFGPSMNRGAKRVPNALEALGDLWEGRRDSQIAVAQDLPRRRGLFGEVEKKELHHMVVAVLNKVTADPQKFREVKNELLRLPIPEANVEQLSKIVDTFFTKAVREQHFCHNYADLITALCKVPQGQHIVGDKTQSLEYRMRAALLKRCQSEFTRSTEAEASVRQRPQSADISDEREKERRDRMCGNVRFISELFLREIVSGSVISVIFRNCCTGSEFGELSLPPRYQPTESQLDEVITAIDAVGDRYFVRNVEGRKMLPLLIPQLEHWMVHHPMSRTRFLLMSDVEKLQAMLATISPISPVISSSNDTRPGGTFQQPSPLIQAQASASMEEQPSPLNATMVGGQPLPAPRSKQHGSASLSDSAGSLNGQPSELPGSTTGNASIVIASMPLLQPVRPEAIAKLMSTLSTGSATSESVATTLLDTYGNIIPAIAVWFDRCLSVVREEKNRKQTGAVLAACSHELSFRLTHSAEHGPLLCVDVTAALRTHVQEAAIAALYRVLGTKLHEDLSVFKFWAQLVLSDHQRIIFDEDLLNEGLAVVAATVPSAVRSYLVDVGRYHTQIIKDAPTSGWQPSTEVDAFVRYRPILVLHGMTADLEGKDHPPLEMLQFTDVRQHSLEAHVYCALCSGTPTADALFDQIRSSPRLTYDPTIAAELLSAVMVAELNSDGGTLIDDSMGLLQIAVDGVNRGLREMAVIAEVYEVLQNATRVLPLTACGRILRKLRSMEVISDESMGRADQHYELEQLGITNSGPTHLSTDDGRATSPERPQIADRPPSDDPRGLSSNPSAEMQRSRDEATFQRADSNASANSDGSLHSNSLHQSSTMMTMSQPNQRHQRAPHHISRPPRQHRHSFSSSLRGGGDGNSKNFGRNSQRSNHRSSDLQSQSNSQLIGASAEGTPSYSSLPSHHRLSGGTRGRGGGRGAASADDVNGSTHSPGEGSRGSYRGGGGRYRGSRGRQRPRD